MTGFFTSSLLKQKLYGVLLVHGVTAEEKQYYCYLSVRLDELSALKKAMTDGELLSLHDYGHVLATGYGEPDEEVREFMRTNYGYGEEGSFRL